MPLLGYLWRVTLSVLTFGVSTTTVKSIEMQTAWFKRYFTGPPSDAEMIAFFQAHQKEFERMAYIDTNKIHCSSDTECARIATILKLRGGHASISDGPNLACRSLPQPKGYGMQFCNSKEYNLNNIEPQDWSDGRDIHIDNNNGQIKAWEKTYVYVAPRIPAEQLGLNPKTYPHDPVEIMRRGCYGNIVDSLDTIPSGLKRSPLQGGWAYPNCAARHIVGQWFIKLRPVMSPP